MRLLFTDHQVDRCNCSPSGWQCLLIGQSSTQGVQKLFKSANVSRSY